MSKIKNNVSLVSPQSPVNVAIFGNIYHVRLGIGVNNNSLGVLAAKGLNNSVKFSHNYSSTLYSPAQPSAESS